MPQLAITDKIKSKLKIMYPSVDVDSIKLYGSENNTSIYIDSIIVPHAYRGQGIGKEIFKQLKQYANKVQKPIVLSPQAEPGYKQKLNNFYIGLGFVKNKGRKHDPSLSSPFGPTMYWKPGFKEWFNRL